ncbi:MAG: hypothetical protein Q7J32_07505 [Sphingomonadaceae bacterium]|nr:hypothetical protein [Sphingomonadaceae bacterium]
MNRLILTAAALMISTSAFAQVATPETTTTTTYGASSTVIAVGDHYTVQTVAADGTVSVKTISGAENLAAAGHPMPAPKTAR